MGPPVHWQQNLNLTRPYIRPTWSLVSLVLAGMLLSPAAWAGAYSLSGTITPPAVGAGATINLSGVARATVTADSSGTYSFGGLLNGSYTVTCTKPGFTFKPASRSVTVNGVNLTGINFTPSPSISGIITPNGSGATISLNGPVSATLTANSSGGYAFAVPNGGYKVTPSKTGFVFSPASRSVTVNSADVPGVNFRAQPIYSFSGTITPNGAGAMVKLSGAVNAAVLADSSGNYALTPGPAVPLVNATAPQVTPTYDGSGQVIEPSIQFFDSGWNGFRYWMLSTPYPNSDATKENPSILVSNDGASWAVPPGLVNPIDLPATGHLGQGELFFDAASNQLWAYYIWGDYRGYSHVLRKVSADGITWSTRQDVIKVPAYGISSQTVGKIGNTYYMWTVNGGTLGCSSTSTITEYRASADGVNWSSPQPVNISQPGYVIWHIEVESIPSKQEYWMLMAAYATGDQCGHTKLFYAKSSDGVNWATYQPPALGTGSSWDSGEIYRSTFTYDPSQDSLNVWYSARGGSAWHLGFTQGNYTGLLHYLQPGVPNGNYTVTPHKTGFVFSPASQSVTVNSADVSGVNFNAQSVTALLNAAAPQVTPTYDGSGQVIEPSIQFFNSGWNGFRYWMVINPYPNSDDSKENPSILVSNDGASWTVPPGLVNPIDLPSFPQSVGHLDDGELFYDAASNQLWVYYIWEDYNGHPLISRVLRRVSSDGVHWSNAVDVVDSPSYTILSPTVTKVGNTYYMWTVNGPTVACSSTSTITEYRTSADGVNWSSPQPVNISQPGYVIWHIEVESIPSKQEYWMLMAAYPTGDQCGHTKLFYAKSSDGVNWTTYQPLALGFGASWDSGEIYRSTFTYDPSQDSLNVWYSARGGSAWHLGFTQGNYTELLHRLQQ